MNRKRGGTDSPVSLEEITVVFRRRDLPSGAG
jgi:hypothetical protein